MSKNTKRKSRRLDKNRITLKKGESQRPDGTYSYRWTGRDGQRQCVYAKTLDELRQKEEQIVVDQHDGIKTNVNLVTVNDMFDLWCELKRGLKNNTFQNYKYMYNLFVRNAFGKQRLTSVKRTDVKRFYNSLTDGSIMKVSTLDTLQNILHQVFDMAVSDNYIRLNPTHNVLRELKKANHFEGTKKKSLTVGEQELFVSYLKRRPMYRHWYPVFAVMLGTGMRVGEITGLRWDDVNFEEGVISVNHTLVYYNDGITKGCSFHINTPKTQAGVRTVPMMDFVRDALLEEREFQKEAEMACQVTIDGYTNFVFINRFGDVQNQGTLNKAIQRVIRDCNEEVVIKHRGGAEPVLLPHFSCHSLRHTFTTRAIEAGMNIKVLQEILGHKDISTTLNIYADVTKDLKQKEIHVLDESFKMFAT